MTCAVNGPLTPHGVNNHIKHSFAAGAPFERKSDSDRHSDSKSATNRSIPSSPHGTPKTHRQASFLHHNVPPIASTVAAAIASVGGGATPHAGTSSAFQSGTSYAGAGTAGEVLTFKITGIVRLNSHCKLESFAQLQWFCIWCGFVTGRVYADLRFHMLVLVQRVIADARPVCCVADG